jgi:hypothetical protein
MSRECYSLVVVLYLSLMAHLLSCFKDWCSTLFGNPFHCTSVAKDIHRCAEYSEMSLLSGSVDDSHVVAIKMCFKLQY